MQQQQQQTAAAPGRKDEFAVCKELRDFLAEGRKPTKEVLDKFRACSMEPATFREILHELAHCDEQGRWKLKSRFQ